MTVDLESGTRTPSSDALDCELFVSTTSSCFERSKMLLMESEILMKVTTSFGEEKVCADYNIRMGMGDKDTLGRKAVTEAFLRFSLLSYFKETGKLGRVPADLSREGLDEELLKHEPPMAEQNTKKWLETRACETIIVHKLRAVVKHMQTH